MGRGYSWGLLLRGPRNPTAAFPANTNADFADVSISRKTRVFPGMLRRLSIRKVQYLRLGIFRIEMGCCKCRYTRVFWGIVTSARLAVLFPERHASFGK